MVAEALGEAAVDLEAVLNYTRSTGIRPVNYTFDPPPGIPRGSGELDARRVVVHDARAVNGLTLDSSGFELVTHNSTLTDWASFQDPQQVTAIDYPQVEAALKVHTRSEKVLIFDHTLRDSSTEQGRAGLREPVRRVHDDQTVRSAPQRVSRHLTPEEASLRLQRRFAIINFWRPIEGAVLQAPLALCDARTIEAADLIPSDLVYPDWIGEIYSFAFNPRHRWYWYPRQTPSEATLLKIFDSSTDGPARLSAHTAFDDPRSAADAPARRSIEIRALVFW